MKSPVSDPLSQELLHAGPQTAEELAARLPGYPPEVIAQALEALADQGVLQREAGEGEAPRYRYTDPGRYHQINLDVVRDPGTGIKRRPRRQGPTNGTPVAGIV